MDLEIRRLIMKRERKNGIVAEGRAAEGSEVRAAAALAAGAKAVQEVPAAEIRTAEAERWSVAELERLAGNPAIKVPAGLEADLERTVEELAAAEMLAGAIRTCRSRRDGTHFGISHRLSHGQGHEQGTMDGTRSGISRRKGVENGAGDGERRFRLRRIRWAVGGIAAGLLLVAGLSLTIASRSEPEDTFSDPKLACAEVEKVMHLISERLTPVRESVDLAGELFKKQIDKLK